MGQWCSGMWVDWTQVSNNKASQSYGVTENFCDILNLGSSFRSPNHNDLRKLCKQYAVLQAQKMHALLAIDNSILSLSSKHKIFSNVTMKDFSRRLCNKVVLTMQNLPRSQTEIWIRFPQIFFLLHSHRFYAVEIHAQL